MAEARAGERVAADEGRRQAELDAQRAHLVLEQLAQRLDQLQLHVLGQAADVVVALDHRRGAAAGRDALDHVRIERALGQERRALDLGRLAVEDVDEHAGRWSCAWPRGRRRRPARRGIPSPHQRGSAGCCSGRGTGSRPRSASFRRSRPVSTKTQVSCSPIASWISTAATERVDAAGEAADHPALARPGRGCGPPPRRGRRPWSSRRSGRRSGG